MDQTIPTYLRSLNDCLSGRSKKIFPNQVVFYHAVFAATNPDLLEESCLDAMCRIGGGGRTAADEELIRKVNYLLRSGLDSNSANVGKHINHVAELPIPRQHKSHYMDPSNKTDIVRRLEAVLWFSSAFHPGRFHLESTDYEEILRQMKDTLWKASETLQATNSLVSQKGPMFGTLAQILYEVVMSHLQLLQQWDERQEEGTEGHPKAGVVPKAVTAGSQSHGYRREYQQKVECHSIRHAGRFYSLQQLAQTNALAAYELGNVYLYGAEYRDEERGQEEPVRIQISPDPSVAALYYKTAASLLLAAMLKDNYSGNT